jgi:hypothetical protein
MSDPTDRDYYSFWYEEKLRFSDIDMLGHVNNVAYAALIETGRLAFWRDGLRLSLPKGLLTVMVRIEIDYKAELHYPATVSILCGDQKWCFQRRCVRLHIGYDSRPDRVRIASAGRDTRRHARGAGAAHRVIGKNVLF